MTSKETVLHLLLAREARENRGRQLYSLKKLEPVFLLKNAESDLSRWSGRRSVELLISRVATVAASEATCAVLAADGNETQEYWR